MMIICKVFDMTFKVALIHKIYKIYNMFVYVKKLYILILKQSAEESSHMLCLTFKVTVVFISLNLENTNYCM